MHLQKSIQAEKVAEKKAQRLGDIVELLTPYSKRKHKLDANFNEAPNKAAAMSNYVVDTWIPRQPDRLLLKELASMVGILDFVGFVFHGVKYWDSIEAIRKMKIKDV